MQRVSCAQAKEKSSSDSLTPLHSEAAWCTWKREQLKTWRQMENGKEVQGGLARDVSQQINLIALFDKGTSFLSPEMWSV